MALRPNPTINAAHSTSRVIPAQISFLTIYNPTFGDSQELDQEQIVFWVGKDELGTSRPGREGSHSSSGRNTGPTTGNKETQEQKLNERLRQVGLARGMVEFARNFAKDQDLDTIETDRSRIVLHELEKDWWILASIDLTQLPPSKPHLKSGDSTKKELQPQPEFSAREVSPAILLRTQLIKAHSLFLLHHAANLWELYNKLGRTNFGGILNRYWESFARKWDVLLHGNPAVDVYGNHTKLAGGGELGVGVGEEEWGSGEREVLEGFVERAEGCVDCIVGRYGPAPSEKSKKSLDANKRRKLSLEEKVNLGEETQSEKWLGTGEDPGPADGVIFSGLGTLSKSSLATVSQWMEAIFRHGDSAYGVGENPASRPRQRRKRAKVERQVSDEPARRKAGEQTGADVHPTLKSSKNKAPDWRRKAIENNAAPPGIPAPLVGAVERSLDEALAKASQRSNSKSPGSSPKSSPKSSPAKEKNQEDAMTGSAGSKDDSSSVFSMEGMKNMLSFGYGSSWTMSPSGFDKKDDTSAKLKTTKVFDKLEVPKTRPQAQRSVSGGKPAEERLQQIDPTPEVSDEDLPFVQQLEQSLGKFLIGLSGDLENMEFEDGEEAIDASSTANRPSSTRRIFLRTLTVELANAAYRRPSLDYAGRTTSQASTMSRVSAGSSSSLRSREGPDPKTSAAASVDGSQASARHEKLQVAVYVHQPFIFVFLFELHTAKLTMPGFYRTIHHSLGPLQKPLLQRTDPAQVAGRIANALNEKNSAAMSAVMRHIDNNSNAIYDLVYDPTKGTIRTSIPNIPLPTNPEAVIKTTATVSGSWYTLGIPIGTSNTSSTSGVEPIGPRNKIEPWTRVEALNVHTQILNTFSATRTLHELERTVKTQRGWWVLWMKVSPPGAESEAFKEAFLVRKSADYTAVKQNRDGGRSGSSAGRWLLRDSNRDVSGSITASGGTASGARGVSEGVGIDAKKWVEGLLSLTQ